LDKICGERGGIFTVEEMESKFISYYSNHNLPYLYEIENKI
jgi:hypothetical protein